MNLTTDKIDLILCSNMTDIMVYCGLKTMDDTPKPPGSVVSLVDSAAGSSTDSSADNDANQRWQRCLLDVVNQATDRPRAQQAFREFFSHFAPKLKGYALAHSEFNSVSFADELIQEVMLKVWQKSSSYQSDKAAVSTWLFTIARNSRTDLIRKHARQPALLSSEDIHEQEDSSANPQSLAQDGLEARQIKEGLQVLNHDQQQVISHVFMQGKTHQETAAELGLPLGTVKSRIRLALGKLKTFLDQHSAGR